MTAKKLMKKILTSLVMIAAVGALTLGATGAFFSDTETSTNNTYAAGTIDISVDDENPWVNSWSNYLDKPCQTNYMNFVIKNEGENPARIWKRLVNVTNGPGDADYEGICSSEPEFVAGGGEFDDGVPIANTYEERNNLSAFMIYDMAVCVVPENGVVDTDCPMVVDVTIDGVDYEKPDLENGPWSVLINEDDQVRVDNVADNWIKIIDQLQPGESLVVSQSYHLMTWDDSGQPIVTNWAQGDIMNFGIELEARQLTAPAPGTEMSGDKVVATVEFVKKDAETWEETDTPQGSLTYEVAADSFNYDINVSGLVDGTEYSLIYYADNWPGNNPGALIKEYTVASGAITAVGESENLDLDLPDQDDANYGAGAKLWLVLTADYDSSTNQMTAWNPDSYLFDKGLVNYDDTDYTPAP